MPPLPAAAAATTYYAKDTTLIAASVPAMSAIISSLTYADA